MSPLSVSFQQSSQRALQKCHRAMHPRTKLDCRSIVTSPTNFTHSQQFVSPFLITAISQRTLHAQSSQNRPNIHKHSLCHPQIYQFSMRPSNLSQNGPVSPQNPKPSHKTASPPSSSKKNEDESESKEIAKKSTWSKIKQYGKTGIAVYCSLWFGMYGIYFAAIHLKVIDIVTITELIPYGKERITGALSSKWGEAAVALVLTEMSEVIRVPMTMFATPKLAKYFESK